MKASIVDLRYKMRDILKALERNERVTIHYHGKIKGIISPVNNEITEDIRNHPFFGMNSKDALSVDEQMQIIRGGRDDDI
ncbi:MAG TPA: type II toxin-antitoxin system Phd/YefM family antitoxin [Spirochaetota bacterium]|nr:type II toxin-antitoxin system Phd/YefM family antitoxin [Spirochaetota bacterium]HPI90906.1 type II toxin-antitoxin system Phd/YefM family antitoxin [Spirochaetota bacterium]